MYHQFNINKFYVISVEYSSGVFFMNLRANSDNFPLRS